MSIKFGDPMITAAKQIALILGLTASSSAWAVTYDFEAITDFSDINAGAVPYYRHNGVNALAINAAVESYRNEFARATLVFEQSSGAYDVTITSLGETDGDGTFRFLVDGEVMGTAINDPATEDYGLQYHTFYNISISEGALIGVESTAVSNGTVPEGDGFAFARGRWVALSLTSVDEEIVTPDPQQSIDLSLTMDVDNNTVAAGETLTFSVGIENTSDEFTATSPEITITHPDSFSNVSSTGCSQSAPSTLTCLISELGPKDTSVLTFTAVADTVGAQEVTASVIADQNDTDTNNNGVSITTNINPVMIESPDVTIDLAVTISADNEQVEVGNIISYNIALANQHATNTASAPVVGILLPDSMQFEASDNCTAENQNVSCSTPEIAPGADASINFSAKAISVDSFAQLFASASSSQLEDIVDNNEAQLVSIINPVELNIEPSQNTPTTSVEKKASGGGALSMLMLPFIAIGVSWRRRKTFTL